MNLNDAPPDDGFGEKVFAKAAHRKEFHRMVVDAFNESQTMAELETVYGLYKEKIDAMRTGSDWDVATVEDIDIRYQGAIARHLERMEYIEHRAWRNI